MCFSCNNIIYTNEFKITNVYGGISSYPIAPHIIVNKAVDNIDIINSGKCLNMFVLSNVAGSARKGPVLVILS